MIGFALSSIAGILAYMAYAKLSITKVFKITEYMIILLGASLLQNGVTKLLATHFSFNLSALLPLPLPFLPTEDSLLGNALQSFLGVDRNFSVVRLCIMAVYIAVIYIFYLKQPRVNIKTATEEI